MRSLTLLSVGLLLWGCGDSNKGRSIAGPARGAPARPRVVQPSIDNPRIATATIAQAPIGPVASLPPIVRGPTQIDVFEQDEAIVDVLWIVDNSGSLSNERRQLAAQFNVFLGVLLGANVDFHVGVTSTDLTSAGDQGRLRGPRRWIDRNTPNPEEAFRAAFSFSNDPRIALEEGLNAMEVALSPPLVDGANAGFIRPEAGLAVIVVSDEDDGSLGPPRHYTRFLRSLKGPGREVNVSFSAVVGPEPDGCFPPGEEDVFGADARAAERYIEVARDTGGLIESICAANFAPFVQSLATSLAGLRRFFPLSAPPEESSIRVLVDGVPIPRDETDGWIYRSEARALVFSGTALPAPGAEIQISYDVRL